METKSVLACKRYHISVSRAVGNQIQTITGFTDLAEAINYISETPPGIQWSVNMSLTKDHTFDMFLPTDTDVVVTMDGPHYRGAYYD